MNTDSQKYKSPSTLGCRTSLHLLICIFFALLCALVLPLPALATCPPDPPPPVPIIKALAADAYVWGLGLETIYRLSKYNTIIGAPYNRLKYGSVPAAWNNEATNGGDASVVYINAFTNFARIPELVFTVPPTLPDGPPGAWLQCCFARSVTA